MIFISHNWNDKPVVEPFATALADAFGRDNVFYDSWSIQPGDGIIDKMNAGLAEANILFVFVSKNSLDSKMVSLEWQNGLYKSVKGDLRIVPVRIDASLMPTILLQNVYIDAVNFGIDVAIQQMLDVAQGKNTFRPADQKFQNVVAYLSQDGNRRRVEMRAEQFMEPHTNFALLFDTAVAPRNVTMSSEGMFEGGFALNQKLGDGRPVHIFQANARRAMSPGFPVVFDIMDAGCKFLGAMREVERGRFEEIPLVVLGPDRTPSREPAYIATLLQR